MRARAGAMRARILLRRAASLLARGPRRTVSAMPTLEHNGLIELFRENPALAPCSRP